MRFADRTAAGEQLAERLAGLLPELVGRAADRGRPQVLALPRGGVPVGRPVADRFGCPLRLLLVRKLGVPGHPELAMGAIAAIGDDLRTVRNRDVVDHAGIRSRVWERVWERERAELQRRGTGFADWIAPAPNGDPVVLIDDGLATGATMRAAVAAVREAGAGPITAAVPVASVQAISDLERDDVTVVALSRPDPLEAVGAAYRDFHQLDDAEVLAELRSGTVT
ncbi:phosphoribosyltransferase [Microlunatus soli]|uniref:Predicted phosphoribosyltransferase n=1 Tax=Microlunatus soli TaxID=630515 RepID=A0A1H1Q7X3_9ACTN|nr:phosphoribosyltransferase family protein [Microlunatus soli]SDS19618.1 Predicted phosphoribosyltransferase [Microlunatus soli]